MSSLDEPYENVSSTRAGKISPAVSARQREAISFCPAAVTSVAVGSRVRSAPIATLPPTMLRAPDTASKMIRTNGRRG